MITTILNRFLPSGRTRREMEISYLNQSVSMHDLERRQREIERGMFR